MNYNSGMNEPLIPAPDTLHIRIAELADLPAIVAIYNQAVPTHCSTANTTPYTVEGRTAWFHDHDPATHPIYVTEADGRIAGWCSLSIYRPGRMALRFTAEMSLYIDSAFHRRGIGKALIIHAVQACPELGIKNVVGVVIEKNEGSWKLLEKLGFERWGYLPRVLDFDGEEVGEYYYGKRVSN